jgi:pyruvate/2-oxoglutarate dehydrogenase complex dihydrolipoamide acyltransferase (E2) component
VPWDRDTIEESVRKTGRLVVVQEDTENCSVGQMIISHLTARPDVWSRLVSPPTLVSKGNVMIGYNPIYEYAALPDVVRIVDAVHRVINGLLPRAIAHPAARELPLPPVTAAPPPVSRASTAASAAAGSVDVTIKVPIMGEGIRAVRVVTLLKQPGDPVALDEPLCEVETDKAVYPIESALKGVFKAWHCTPDDVLDIGREIAVVTVAAADAPPAATAAPAPAAHPSIQQLQQIPRTAPAPAGLEPALSPAITRRLSGVIPVNMQLDALWKNLRAAREAIKATQPDCTPSLMLGWCIVRAMAKHAAFRRLVLKEGEIVERECFDLGVAVALDDDRLATAIVPGASSLDWPAFCARYVSGLAAVRAGKIEDVQTPLILTSLGAFGIEIATPMVVPPSMSTLFVGKTHERMLNHDGVIYPEEVATLSLTFDHRVVNGAGAAAFLRDVRAQIENFQLPA